MADETLFSIGDKVLLCEDCRWLTQKPGPSNPANMEGEIIAVVSGSRLPYQVCWDSGHMNTYAAQDLTPIVVDARAII